MLQFWEDIGELNETNVIRELCNFLKDFKSSYNFLKDCSNCRYKFKTRHKQNSETMVFDPPGSV